MLPGTIMQQLKIIWWLSKTAFERSWMWWCSLIPGKRSHWFWWNFFLCPMYPKNIKSYLGLSFKFSLINWRTLLSLLHPDATTQQYLWEDFTLAYSYCSTLNLPDLLLSFSLLICTSITVCYIERVYDTFLFVIYKHETVAWICHLPVGNKIATAQNLLKYNFRHNLFLQENGCTDFDYFFSIVLCVRETFIVYLERSNALKKSLKIHFIELQFLTYFCLIFMGKWDTVNFSFDLC